MREFLTRIEDLIATAGKKASSLFSSKKEGGEDASAKKTSIFDRMDAKLAKYDAAYLSWCFFLSAAIMLLVYVAMDVYPFGKSSVLVLDLNGQYVQFFAGLRAILHGDGSILYSFSRSLGGEFLGIFTYYLASPFSWLVAIFPEKNLLEALLVMFVLKSGVTGLSFGIFLHYSRRPPNMMTIGLSLLYALSSYGVVMQHNTMWMDAMMLLPLMMLGLERLIRHGRPILYTATLALILLANYYIGFMVCIFTVMYFFYYHAAHTADITNPRGERHHFIASLTRVGIYSVLGVLLAAILLLPAYYSLTFGKTDFSNPNFGFFAKFDIIDFLAKMFPGAYDTVRPEGLPWVYSGTIALILFPVYFLASKIPSREKIASGILVLFLFLSMYVNTFDVLWHGGQAPNWLNYRYSFLFIFMVLLLSARALTALKSVDYRAILAVASVLLILVVVLQKLGLEYTTNGTTKEYFDDLNGVWLSIGCLAIYAIVLLFLNGHDRSSPRYEPIATILVAVLYIETLLNGIFYLRRLNEDVVISSYDSYHNFYDVYDDPFDYVASTEDDLFYRMDKTFQHTVCDSFVLGYNGLASSTSTLNASVVKFQHAIGLKANSHWTEATGSTIVTNSLLGVKYWVAKADEEVDPLYSEYHRDGDAEAGTATVTYRNPYALPLAFASNGAIRDITFALPTNPPEGYELDGGIYKLKEEWKNALWSPFARMNSIYAAMTGDSTLTVYDPIDSTLTVDGGMRREANAWSHAVFKTEKNNSTARIVLTFVAPDTLSPIYCYFPSYYTREATMYVNGEKQANPLYPECANIATVLSLGTFLPGETVTVELSIEKYGEFYLIDSIPYFYTIDEADLTRATNILQAGGINLTRADDDHFCGTLTATEGFTTVQTTIPYDAGWQIEVDGAAVTGYQTMDAMLAFDLPDAGTYEITLRYRPSIYTVGLLASLAALLLFAAIVTLEILRKKNRISVSGRSFFGRILLFLLPPFPKADEKNAFEEAATDTPKKGNGSKGKKQQQKKNGKAK